MPCEPRNLRPMILAQLREQVRRCERGAATERPAIVSSGFAELDRILPDGGFRRGLLVEWLSPGPGHGATTLALRALGEACRDGRPAVVVDGGDRFYPPAAAALGLDPARLLIVRCRTPADQLWACRQALATVGVGGVIAWCERFDARAVRRLQLAAESGGTLGFLLRDLRAAGQPCFADVRLSVRSCASRGARRLEVEVLRSRGGMTGAAARWELDDDAHPLPAPAEPQRRTGT